MESMLLIVAALAEELQVALDLCPKRAKITCGGRKVWTGEHKGNQIWLLKSGTGPRRSAASVERVLARQCPSFILGIGYGGSLDPGLDIGDLVLIRRASLLGSPQGSRVPLADLVPTGSWELSEFPDIMAQAKAAGLNLARGDILTSPWIVGDPAQKLALHRRFQAALVDMETAAIARAAASRGIRYCCVRAVSDRADDTFLAPLGNDPSASTAGRALRALGIGNWIHLYREWKKRTAVARRNLRRFLAWYLEQNYI